MRLRFTFFTAVLIVTAASAAAQSREDWARTGAPDWAAPRAGTPTGGAGTQAAGVASLPAMPANAVPPPRRKKPRVGVHGYLLVETESLKAMQSFTAVIGSSRLTGRGAGADIVNLWKGVFARVSFAHMSGDGSRVFVDSSQRAISLHIPLTVTMTPVEIGGGWRFTQVDKSGRFVPYLGAAILRLHYQETSEFAEPDENTDDTFTGRTLFAGFDVSFAKVVHVAIEGLYRRVPQDIDVGGTLAAFKETGLGGRVFRFRVGVGF